MTRHIASLGSLLLLSCSLSAAPEAPAPRPATRWMADLVERLGSPDYVTRELATRELERVGPVALPALQKALAASTDGEVVRRAGQIVARLEKRLADEKALAATLVTLPPEKALGEVIADLAKQSHYSLQLAGKLDAKKVLKFRSARISFWDAVEQVCDAADLQIAAVSGFAAPGSVHGQLLQTPGLPNAMPPGAGVMPQIEAARRQRYGRPSSSVAPPTTAIVLEPRQGARRPASNHGAVRLEVVALPAGALGNDGVAALVQVWAEPKLRWEQTRGVRVRQARDDRGQALAPDLTSDLAQVTHVADGNAMFVNGPGGALVVNGGNIIIQGNVQIQGNIVINEGNLVTGGDSRGNPAFVPNAMQAVVRLQAGERPSDALKELAGCLEAVVRTAPEALITVGDLSQSADQNHPAGVRLRCDAIRQGEDGSFSLAVTLEHNPNAIQAAGGPTPADYDGLEILGRPRGAGGRGIRRTIGVAGSGPVLHGLRVTDAAGKPYHLITTGANQMVSNGQTSETKLTLRLTPTVKDQGPPKAIAFWGTKATLVDVPFRLKDVPVVAAKK